MSEIRKDVEALRVIGFSEQEIAQQMTGRRAVSKQDIGAILKGFYNPSNPPKFQQDSALISIINQINKELDTKYKPKDFVNFKDIAEIQKKYVRIPLGLSEEEFDNAIRGTRQFKKELLEDEQEGGGGEINNQQSSLIQQTPAAPNIPMPTNIVTNVAQINPQSGLTSTEEALLSPEEKVIASRRNQGIMGLV
jgi:hypothetical protein